MSERIGFIGVGNMGLPIVRNLLVAGFAVDAHDIHDDRGAAAAAAGAELAHSPAQVAARAELVITMVPDDRALEEVVSGREGLLGALRPGAVHMSLSTIAPPTSDRLERLWAERGVTYLAATVLGRPEVATAGQLTVFLAGAETGRARVRPVLEAISRAVHEYGDVASAANVVKVAANFLILAALEAMGEAAALVDACGIDRAAFLSMIVETPLFGGAVYEGYGAMIGRESYEPALFPVPIGLKDARLIIETGRGAGVRLPVAELAREHLEQASASGWEAQDWSVLARAAKAALTSPRQHV